MNQPDYQEIYLKDAFRDIKMQDDVFLDFKAIMLNINYGHNKELMEKCQPLKEYAIFVDMIRKFLDSGMSIRQAAYKTVEKCLEKGILKDILSKEKGEIEDMITICYDEELHRKQEAKYHEEIGEKRGEERGRKAEKQEIALKLWRNGNSMEEITTITSLTSEEIRQLTR